MALQWYAEIKQSNHSMDFSTFGPYSSESEANKAGQEAGYRFGYTIYSKEDGKREEK